MPVRVDIGAAYAQQLKTVARRQIAPLCCILIPRVPEIVRQLVCYRNFNLYLCGYLNKTGLTLEPPRLRRSFGLLLQSFHLKLGSKQGRRKFMRFLELISVFFWQEFDFLESC